MGQVTNSQGSGAGKSESLSVLMAVYLRESPVFLDIALQSIERQSLQPDEVVLVTDPLGPELRAVIAAHESTLPIVEVALPAPVGLGEALRIGVEHCRGELIARMDTDDICVTDRLRRQVEFLREHPEIDLLGGSIAEFLEDPQQLKSIRKMPELHDEISRTARSRCPVNHMTVMFRKAAVLKAGNYQDDRRMEDYRLWARMLLAGSRFHNLDEVLVLARIGNGMIRRRGGFIFMQHELKLQSYFRKIGFTSLPRLVFNFLARIPVLFAPHALRKFMYQYVLRRAVPPEARYS